MRRGQLSILLIAAAVLVIVFGLLMLIGRVLQPSAAEGTLNVRGADANTTLCLQDATIAAVMNAMLQGGVTVNASPRQPEWGSGLSEPAGSGNGARRYDVIALPNTPADQLGEWRKDGSGRTAPNAYFEHPATKELILVGVQRGPDRANWSTATPGRLPPSAEDGTPLYGALTFEPLCSRNGSNKPNADGTGALTCLPGTYHIVDQNILSFQTRLEESITKIVQANPDACPATTRVQVTLGESDVVVQVENESVRVPIRLKALYNAAWNFARLEVSQRSHLLTPQNGENPWRPVIAGCKPEINGGNCLLPGMDVLVEKEPDKCEPLDGSGPCTYYGNPEPPGYEEPITIVSIRDQTARFDGTYPAFRFAVRNRYPFLSPEYEDVLPTTEQLLQQYYTPLPTLPILVAGCSEYDRTTNALRDVPVPTGFDPDDRGFTALIRLENDADGTIMSVPPGLLSLRDPTGAQPPQPLTNAVLSCGSNCPLAISCSAWRNAFDDGSGVTQPVTFQAVLCASSTVTNDLFAVPYPDGDSSIAWPRNCHRVRFSLDDE
jgi:hypothetical protein